MEILIGKFSDYSNLLKLEGLITIYYREEQDEIRHTYTAEYLLAILKQNLAKPEPYLEQDQVNDSKNLLE